MAETLLFLTVEKLVERLGSVTVKSWNVKKDLEKLKNTMLTIKAVLLDAEEQHGSNHQLKDWLEKLDDALEDAADLLDDFSTQALRQEVMTRHKKAKKVRIFFSSSNPVVFSFKMAHKIKEIREKLEAIDDDRKKFHFTNRTLEQRVQRQRQTHSFIREEDVVGREEEKKALLEFLLNTNMGDTVSIISIIGIGGLRKIALAQLIYNDNAVQRHFELKMWVCVSDYFDVKTIASKIIGSKTNDEMDQVQQELRKKIESKRYLLVLDDIWNEDRDLWLQLMTLLWGGGNGSKIVITTRSEKVAKITGISSHFFLKGLNEEQSWKLFTQIAFENGKEPENKKLIEIGKEILTKCAGVPLAIRSIGSLMYSKESENDWLNFKDKDLVKIDEEGDRVFSLIKLSYDHLPFYLKKCVAFCSLFPKGSDISKRILILLWVAQGFVQSLDESICLEDVGNEYFMTLTHRSFFQNLRRDEFGNIYCKMHDLVQDLAMFVARNDCVIVNEEGQHINERIRHLSFGFFLDSSWKVPSFLLRATKLRTFLVQTPHFYEAEQSIKESTCNLIMPNLKQVRILDLHHLNLRTLPSCIGMLKHLRYLDLSWNRQIEVLPESITKLQNLQTLLLNDCYRLRELPKDLWKLISLRHLQLDWCSKLTCMPRGIGGLTKLQTLSFFVFDTTFRHNSGKANELSGLNNLRGRLEIKGLECLRHHTMQAKALNLMQKSHLESLNLTWNKKIDADQNIDNEVADDILLSDLQPHYNIKKLQIKGFCGVTISGWLSLLTNLMEISLEGCTRMQNLPLLHRLLHIKQLSLANLPCLEWIDKDGSDDSSSAFFPSLKEIFLCDLPNFQGWWRCSEEGMLGGHCHQQPLLFKSLTDLRIYSCPNLISLPLHPYVESIELGYVSEKILQQVLKLCTTPLLSNSFLSTLQYMSIGLINDLKSMYRVLQYLTALRKLDIVNCMKLDPCNDENGCYGMQWKEIKNLGILHFDNIPNMELLPEGLQYVTTLETLRIVDCANLSYLPEWIACLGSSLQQFEIIKCPKLTSLPEGMCNLTPLQTLRIIECPRLEERCKREAGEN